MLTVVNVPGDGDCFFSCVSIALASVKVNYTPTALRQLVAMRALNPKDKFFNEMLKATQDIVNSQGADYDLVRQFAFVLPVAHVPFEKWTSRERTLVYNNLMSRAVYWADETAIRTMEACSDLIFLVIRRDMRNDEISPVSPLTPASSIDIRKHVFVVLDQCDDVHYRIYCYGQPRRYVFTLDTLPVEVYHLFEWVLRPVYERGVI